MTVTNPQTGQSSGIAFFGLLFAISLPFWALGFIWDGMLLPGLPVSAAMVICPSIAAIALVYRTGGLTSLKPFLNHAYDGARMRPWAWLAAVTIMPGVMLASALVQIVSGDPLPPPQFSAGQVLALFALFLASAIAEELGWTGFATKRLLRHRSLLATGLIVGSASALWHLVPLLQAGRNWEWIAWWVLGTLSRRILIVWIYRDGGQSVFATSLFHAMSNLSWMLFPVMGSHYDPAIVGLILLTLVVPIILLDRATPGRAPDHASTDEQAH